MKHASLLLEGVGQRHRDGPLLRGGVQAQGHPEGHRLHHARAAVPEAAVHPGRQGQGEARIGGCRRGSWDDGAHGDGLGEVGDVAGDGLRLKQPIVACEREDE